MKIYVNKNLKQLENAVIRSKNGDKESTQYIIDFFKPFIKKYSKTTFIKSMDEKDIEQTLILNLLLAINKYEGNDKFFWYAIQTMKNNLYNTLKKSKKESNNVNIEKIPIADEFYVDDKIIKEEEIRELYAGLNKLCKSDSDLLIKIYFYNYSYKKLMEYFGKSYTALGSRKNRALKKLKLLI